MSLSLPLSLSLSLSLLPGDRFCAEAIFIVAQCAAWIFQTLLDAFASLKREFQWSVASSLTLGTHYPYIQPIYTARIYGHTLRPYIRAIYTVWCISHPYIRAVYMAHMEKACHAMLFSSMGRIYG